MLEDHHTGNGLKIVLEGMETPTDPTKTVTKDEKPFRMKCSNCNSDITSGNGRCLHCYQNLNSMENKKESLGKSQEVTSVLQVEEKFQDATENISKSETVTDSGHKGGNLRGMKEEPCVKEDYETQRMPTSCRDSSWEMVNDNDIKECEGPNSSSLEDRGHNLSSEGPSTNYPVASQRIEFYAYLEDSSMQKGRLIVECYNESQEPDEFTFVCGMIKILSFPNQKGTLFRGTFLDQHFLACNFKYRYTWISDGKPLISEYLDSANSKSDNIWRCLNIKETHKTGVWYQFDFIHVKARWSFWKSSKNTPQYQRSMLSFLLTFFHIKDFEEVKHKINNFLECLQNGTIFDSESKHTFSLDFDQNSLAMDKALNDIITILPQKSPITTILAVVLFVFKQHSKLSKGSLDKLSTIVRANCDFKQQLEGLTASGRRILSEALKELCLQAYNNQHPGGSVWFTPLFYSIVQDGKHTEDHPFEKLYFHWLSNEQAQKDLKEMVRVHYNFIEDHMTFAQIVWKQLSLGNWSNMTFHKFTPSPTFLMHTLLDWIEFKILDKNHVNRLVTHSDFNKALSHVVVATNQWLHSRQNSRLPEPTKENIYECLDLAIRGAISLAGNQEWKSKNETLDTMLEFFKLLDSFNVSELESLRNYEEYHKTLSKNVYFQLGSFMETLIEAHLITQKKALKDNISVWGQLFEICLPDPEWQKEWQTLRCKLLRKKVKKMSSGEQIKLYYSYTENMSGNVQRQKPVNKEMENCFLQCATEAATIICQQKGRDLQNIMEMAINSKCTQLISAVVENILGHVRPLSITKDGFSQDISSNLKNLLSSNDCLVLLSKLDECHRKTLSSRTQECLNKVKELMQFLIQGILSGDVPCTLLMVALTPVGKKMCMIFSSDISQEFACALKKRNEELKYFENKKNQVDNLLKLCGCIQDFINVNCDRLCKIRKICFREENRSVNELIQFVDDCGRLEDVQPGQQSCYTNMFHKIGVLMNSTYFIESWKQTVKKAKEEIYKNTSLITLEQLHDNIYKPVLKEYHQSFVQLEDLSMSLCDVQTKFRKILADEKVLKKELQALQDFHSSGENEDHQWINTAFKQIVNYGELCHVIKTAGVVNEVCNDLSLKGNLGALNSLQGCQDCTSKSLKDISPEMVEAGGVLKEIPENVVHFLEGLHTCAINGFILWVKTIIKDFKELPAFVDLASISAGENDIDVDKVRCFRDAIIAAAPFIYNLSPDTGLKEFMEAVHMLEVALKNDPKAKEKLIDSCNNKDWLQIVHDSHGSVERSSLTQAKEINESGIYVISRPPLLRKPTVNDCISLNLNKPDKDDESKILKYSLSNLTELQNKLMLISASVEKGREEIDKYVKVSFRICAACSRTLLLFIDWKLSVYCDSKRPVTVHVNFGIAGVQIDGKNPIQEELKGLCESMKKCLDVWYIFLETQRNEYYYLNYFTSQQLVTLCCSMARLKCGGNLSASDLNMFSFIKNGATNNDLKDSLNEALQAPANRSSSTDFQSSDFHKYLIMFPKLIKDLTDAGEEEPKVKAALQHCGQDGDVNEETLLECIFEHLDDETLVMELSEKYDKTTEEVRSSQMKFKGGDEMNSSFLMTKEETSIMFECLPSCQEKIMMLWEVYNKKLSGLVSDKYISLDVLGEMLDCLAQKETHTVERTIPSFMQTGKPNLIRCKDVEMLPLMLSVYKDKAQPLPTYDEVLSCTYETSVEAVELIIRRALKSNGKNRKIYCLLNADKLDNEVARKLESFFFQISQTQSEYMLLIICDSKAQDSYVITAFDSYKITTYTTLTYSQLQEYLKEKLDIESKDVCIKSVLTKPFQQNTKIVFSENPGMGKSLYIRNIVKNCEDTFKDRGFTNKTIQLTESEIKPTLIVHQLQQYMDEPTGDTPRVFHFDISAMVTKGLYNFLVQLLVLRCFQSPDGLIWRCKDSHLYLVEYLQRKYVKCYGRHSEMTADMESSILALFPAVECFSPNDVVEHLSRCVQVNSPEKEIQLIDENEFKSDGYQRTYQYLKKCKTQQNLQNFTFKSGQIEDTDKECLEVLLEYCGTTHPSWMELRNFTHFLNLQLTKCENSIFCSDAVKDCLKNFKAFVVKSMIVMSEDFTMPSMKISDESSSTSVDEEDKENSTTGDVQNEEELKQFQLRRRWEQQAHPYVIFNADDTSMTFLGFHINANMDAVDVHTNKIIKEKIISKELHQQLVQQHVPFNIKFENLSRKEQLNIVGRVLGGSTDKDPDESYQLTLDNVLKMFAIHFRFQCGIPVVIMGDTGCGKTRLVQFMCELQRSGREARNMLVVRVHGGTTAEDIYSKVKAAMVMATENKKNKMDTILFFDEANTTEAVYAIKEVLCDKTVNGEPINTPELKFIAACNPYKKHSQKAIEQLEKAGLGYRICSENTVEKLGQIPMRQLVYRVQPMPPSMLPLVWDFGQLNKETERLYIIKMVNSFLEKENLPKEHAEVFTTILSESQRYLTEKEDECRMVSLRDIERCMVTTVWFHNQKHILFPLIDEKKKGKESKSEVYEMEDPIRSLILAVGVCYYASLEYREDYLTIIGTCLSITGDVLFKEIDACQEVFMDHVFMPESTAKNDALKENVFMMVVCMNLRIPLFLVGKPGSSKSLSKTIAGDAMQGKSSKSELFKTYKQAQLVSFQCSPHSTPEGIISTFRHCAQFQKGQDLHKYVSVVVLDEIGLAEDSHKMPLKALHPLLEDGCVGDDEPEPFKKVGFIGISNWSLDPAKMNRGLLVLRTCPAKQELIKTAKDICSYADPINLEIELLIPYLAKFYIKVLNEQCSEFFGLRDYYSLIKMVLSYIQEKKKKPSNADIARAVQRNFGGLESINILDIFSKCLYLNASLEELTVSSVDLLKENLEMNKSGFAARYLLLLTTNFAALPIIQRLNVIDINNTEIIFGSGFPKDQEYSQVCCDINRIKICMETGKPVILLNIQNLYESLYDALNQCYVKLGGNYYVDLGLGSHRVKCRVKENFRLIVIEEKSVVYEQFPTPLLNRMEKHCMEVRSVLSDTLMSLCNSLQEWVKLSAGVEKDLEKQSKQIECDTFIGYTGDTCASIIQEIAQKYTSAEDNLSCNDKDQIIEEAKSRLIQGATPDAVLRMTKTISEDHSVVQDLYFLKQSHVSLIDVLKTHRKMGSRGICLEISTYSRLLNQTDVKLINKELDIENTESLLLRLSQFDTEQDFRQKLSEFFSLPAVGRKLLILQSYFEESTRSQHLLSCVRYCVTDIKKKLENDGALDVALLTRLHRIAGGCNYTAFSGADWIPLHLDELILPQVFPANIGVLANMTRPEILEESFYATLKEGNDCEIPLNQNQKKYEKLIDIQALIKQSMQKGAMWLRDMKDNTDRATIRIKIIVDLLCHKNPDVSTDFMKLLQHRMLLLLREQEEKKKEKENWAVCQARADNYVVEGGSFRHMLWVHLEDYVASALAQILAVIDGDDNLDHLCGHSSQKTEVWFRIFQDENLLRIAPIPMQAGIQTAVFSSVDGQETFSKCSFPFSWILKEKLDKIWRSVAEHQGHSLTPQMDSVDRFENLIKADFSWIKDINAATGLFIIYAEDFIKMSLPGQEPQIYQTFSNALVKTTKRLYYELTQNDPSSTPLYWLHITYDYLRTNHHVFADLCHNCVQLRLELRKGDWKSSEYVDLEAAIFALKGLAPAEEKLKDFKSCQEWLQGVKSVHPTVEFITSEEFPVHLYGQNANELLKTCKLLWHCIRIVYLLMDHLLYSETEIEEKLLKIIVKYFSFLFGYLKRKETTDMEYTFNNVTKVLKNCNNNACNVYFGKCNCNSIDPVQLPCGHICCQVCLKEMNAKKCLTCNKDIPENYVPSSSEAIRKATLNMNKFRSKCNSFFVEFIMNYFVGENIQMPEGIIKQLVTFVGANTSNQQEKGKAFVQTNDLSPFEECMDPSPTVKSTLLKILLRCRLDEMKPYLQEYIEDVVKTNKNTTQFYFLVVRSMEDLMYKPSHGDFFEEALKCLSFDKDVFDCTDPPMTIDNLYIIARVRFAISIIAGVIGECLDIHESKSKKSIYDKEKTELVLQKIQELIAYCKNPWITIFLLRNLCNMYGPEIAKKICQMEIFNRILPIKLDEDNAGLDKFFLYGKQYDSIRNKLEEQQSNDSSINLKELDAQGGVDSVCMALATVKQICQEELLEQSEISLENAECEKKKPGGRDNTLIQKLLEHSSQTGTESAVSCLCLKIAQDSLSKASEELSISHPSSLFEIVFHTVLVIRQSSNSEMELLKFLCFQPKSLEGLFIPTMPDLYDEVAKIEKNDLGKLWQCKNGHLVTIGKCGNPTNIVKCLDCGVEVGGISHKPVEGFKPISEEDMKGHILSAPSSRTLAASVRELSGASLCLTRVLIHSSMLWGRICHPEDIQKCIKESDGDAGQCLCAHLKKDIELLGEAIGKNWDDTLNTVHLFLKHLLETHTGTNIMVHSTRSREERAKWENAIKDIIQEFFKGFEEKLSTMHQLILYNNRPSVLRNIAYSKCPPLTDLPTTGLFNLPEMWRIEQRMTVQYLCHLVERENGKMKFPVLSEFLTKLQHIRYLKFLPQILEIQKILVHSYKFSGFQGWETETIQTFVKECVPDDKQKRFIHNLDVLKNTWCHLKENYKTENVQLSSELLIKDISADIMAHELLPKEGSMVKIVTRYLVKLQNNCTDCARTITKEMERSISAGEVRLAHVITCDPENDFLPMALSNTQYTLSEDGHKSTQYNFRALEIQIINRFISGKPVISLTTIPTVELNNVQTMLSFFNQMREKMETLPWSSQNYIMNEMRFVSDISAALSTLRVAIGFLAVKPENPDRLLISYIRKELCMEEKSQIFNLPVLKESKVKHCQSLWQLLSAKRAALLVQMNQNPFFMLDKQFQDQLNEEQDKKLGPALKTVNLDCFIIAFHDFIMNLDALGIQPRWTIAEVFQPFLHEKGIEVPSLEKFAESLHVDFTINLAVSVWKKAVQIRKF